MYAVSEKKPEQNKTKDDNIIEVLKQGVYSF